MRNDILNSLRHKCYNLFFLCLETVVFKGIQSKSEKSSSSAIANNDLSDTSSSPSISNAIVSEHNDLLSQSLPELLTGFKKLYGDYLQLNLELETDFKLTKASQLSIKKLYAHNLLKNIATIPGISFHLVGRQHDIEELPIAIKLNYIRGSITIRGKEVMLPGMDYTYGCSRIEGVFIKLRNVVFFLTLGGITKIRYTNNTQEDSVELKNDTPHFAQLDSSSQIIFQDANLDGLKNTYKVSELAFANVTEQESSFSTDDLITLLNSKVVETYTSTVEEIKQYCQKLAPQKVFHVSHEAERTIIALHQASSKSLRRRVRFADDCVPPSAPATNEDSKPDSTSSLIEPSYKTYVMTSQEFFKLVASDKEDQASTSSASGINADAQSDSTSSVIESSQSMHL